MIGVGDLRKLLAFIKVTDKSGQAGETLRFDR